MTNTVIEVRDLTVGRVAEAVSFTVTRGEIVALYGFDAGMILDVVVGQRAPVSGTVRVGGIDPLSRPVGSVWRDSGLFPGLTVDEVIGTWRRWTLDPITRQEALQLCGLADRAHARFEELTPVERRRLDLALIGRSDVLFLEEPTIGLDPPGRREIWAMLRSLAERGVTILLATTDFMEARRADRTAPPGRAIPQ